MRVKRNIKKTSFLCVYLSYYTTDLQPEEEIFIFKDLKMNSEMTFLINNSFVGLPDCFDARKFSCFKIKRRKKASG